MSASRAIAALKRAKAKGLTVYTTKHYNFSRDINGNKTARFEILAGLEIGDNKEVIYQGLRNSQYNNEKSDQAQWLFEKVYSSVSMDYLVGSMSGEYYLVECKL